MDRVFIWKYDLVWHCRVKSFFWEIAEVYVPLQLDLLSSCCPAYAQGLNICKWMLGKGELSIPFVKPWFVFLNLSMDVMLRGLIVPPVIVLGWNQKTYSKRTESPLATA